MCQPDLNPGLAPGAAAQRCWLGGAAPLLSSPGCSARLGAAPRPGCWALPAPRAELRPSGASSGCVTDACHAAVPCLNWPRRRWVCTAPPALPAPPSPPSLSPRQCAALSSRLPGRAQLHFQLLQTFSAFAIQRHPPSGPAPPVPASLPLRYPVKRLLLLLRWTSALADLIWDEGWRLPASERRTLGSFPFAKWAVIARRQPPQLESIVCFLAAKGTLEQQ